MAQESLNFKYKTQINTLKIKYGKTNASSTKLNIN